ncbi:2829_t:CDS:1, partial [Cetraspora pellucida]
MPYKIWNHFTKLGQTKEYKQPHIKCNYCKNECNDNVIRSEGHLKICEKLDSTIKQQYFDLASKQFKANT